MFLSWIAFDIVSLIMSKFFWAESLIESYFSCPKANSLLNFREAAFFRDSNILMSDKGTLIGKAQLLANAGIEMLPVKTTVAAVTAFEIVAKRFNL